MSLILPTPLETISIIMGCIVNWSKNKIIVKFQWCSPLSRFFAFTRDFHFRQAISTFLHHLRKCISCTRCNFHYQSKVTFNCELWDLKTTRKSCWLNFWFKPEQSLNLFFKHGKASTFHTNHWIVFVGTCLFCALWLSCINLQKYLHVQKWIHRGVLLK